MDLLIFNTIRRPSFRSGFMFSDLTRTARPTRDDHLPPQDYQIDIEILNTAIRVIKSISNDLMQRFIENIMNQRLFKTSEEIARFISFNAVNLFDNALYWANTPEGRAYWGDANSRYNRKYNQLRNAGN